MALGKAPAFQMYTGDWLSDPALSRCEEATRGIWVDVICNMQREGKTGVISGTLAQLARMCRTTAERMKIALIDLQNTNTADVETQCNGEETVTITNRRMAREYEESIASNERVKNFRARNGDVTPKKRRSSSSSSLERKKERSVAAQSTEPEPEPATPWPESHAVVNEHHPGTLASVTEKLALIATRNKPDISDSEFAVVLTRTHWEGDKSPWAWAKKIPAFLRSGAGNRTVCIRDGPKALTWPRREIRDGHEVFVEENGDISWHEGEDTYVRWPSGKLLKNGRAVHAAS